MSYERSIFGDDMRKSFKSVRGEEKDDCTQNVYGVYIVCREGPFRFNGTKD